MKSISDIINESLLNASYLNEGYDKEIFQQIKRAINRDDEYCFYAVSFNDIDGNNGYLVLEQNNNIDKYLRQNKNFILHYEQISYKDIESSLYLCETRPSTFYCCGVVLKDIDKTKGYLFLNLDDADKRPFEKWLNHQVELVDVI